MRWKKEWKKEWLLYYLFPPRCPFCDKVLFYSMLAPREFACKVCQDKPEYAEEPVCSRCGQPLEDERQEYCYDCARKKHGYKQGKALWAYKGAVKDSLYRFKYQGRREYAEYYGRELARMYGGWVKRCGVQAIVPIPISKKRMRQRGFNQAGLVAGYVGKELGIPVYQDLLLRVRDTKAQKGLNDEERKNNLKRAFKTRINKVQLDHILLIDDIYTTGSTMDEAARELRQAGAKEVYCLSVSIGRGY